MNDMQGFLIEDGMLLEYTDSDVNLAIPKGVTHIDSYAFEKFTNLMRITIPDSVVSIGGARRTPMPMSRLRRKKKPPKPWEIS